MKNDKPKLDLAHVDTGENGERVDYHETDLGFRHRLDSLVPPEMAARVQKILSKKLTVEDDDSAEAVNM